MKRRQAIKHTSAMVGGLVLAPSMFGCGPGNNDSEKEQKNETSPIEPAFKISLAQWSLHNAYFGNFLDKGWEHFGNALHTDPDSVLAGSFDPLRFAEVARRDFNIEAIEYVNTFYFGKGENMEYLGELKNIAANEGVISHLIMCDAEGNLGDPDNQARQQTVDNHKKWVDAAEFLGCKSIRVNARSDGGFDEQMKLAADGLRTLCEYAESHKINIIVENHGGISSNGQWLSGVMKMVDHPLIGTLPDFGNFRISETENYDRYKGMEELMPYAKGVSAKSHEFDENGNEREIDYPRIMDIVLDAGYHGYVGIEYEGQELGEYEGIRATKALLESILEQKATKAA